MRHTPRRHYLLLGLIVLVLTMGAMPAQAAYTKLYRFTNNTETDKGGVRVVLNSLETTTADFVAPLQWGDDPYPAIANILFSGTYCTKLKWFGNPVPVGGVVKVGGTTADDSCRLRDLRWITTAGNLAGSVTEAAQTQGAPGGGQVTYDPEVGGYIWTVTNDTGLPIDLSSAAMSVLEYAPTLVELDQMVWPVDVLKAVQGELPHPDVVALRVGAIISQQLEPLIDSVWGARQDGYLSAQDAADLLGRLDAAIAALEAGGDTYDPSSPGDALEQWEHAIDWLEEFQALVAQFSGPRYAYETLPPEWRGLYSPYEPLMGVNDSGKIAAFLYQVGIKKRGLVWEPDGEVVELPIGSWSQSAAHAVNASGCVAGSVAGSGAQHVVRWEPDGSGGYVLRDIHFQSEWYQTAGNGINDQGQVAGIGGYRPTAHWPHAFLWDPVEGTSNLGPYRGYDVNSRGEVLAKGVEDGYSHVYVRDADGVWTDLHPGDPWGEMRAYRMSESGQVAGVMWRKGDIGGEGHAWLAWVSDGSVTLHDLHDPDAWGSSGAVAANDSGQVVGSGRWPHPGHATLWDTTKGTHMDIHPPGWASSYAESISDTGIVAGKCSTSTGEESLFRATPIPEQLPEGLAQEWLDAADATIAEIEALPGPPAAGGDELPPPPEPPPPPPEGEQQLTYLPWDEMQEQAEPTLPPSSYTAFVVPDEDQTPDEAVMLVVQYPVIESVELYTASDPYNPPVGDTTPPVIAGASITPDLLWPPNHKMVKMTLDVTVADDGGSADWYIESVTSNQPVNGTDDGDTAPDWFLSEDTPQSLSLRAERSGADPDGRTYTICLRAIDATGNLSVPTDPSNLEDPAVVQVFVPLDMETPETAIMLLAAAPAGRGNVQINFTLSSSGKVDAEVLNIAGRRIRSLLEERKCDKGATSLVWSCRSDRGLAVPAGAYLIRLTVHTDDGQQASGLCSVMLRK